MKYQRQTMVEIRNIDRMHAKMQFNKENAKHKLRVLFGLEPWNGTWAYYPATLVYENTAGKI